MGSLNIVLLYTGAPTSDERRGDLCLCESFLCLFAVHGSAPACGFPSLQALCLSRPLTCESVRGSTVAGSKRSSVETLSAKHFPSWENNQPPPSPMMVVPHEDLEIKPIDANPRTWIDKLYTFQNQISIFIFIFISILVYKKQIEILID